MGQNKKKIEQEIGLINQISDGSMGIQRKVSRVITPIDVNVEGVKTIGAADTITKAYIRENAVFADAFNYFIYKGSQVVSPEELQEVDTTEIIIPFNTYDESKDEKKSAAVQKYRDVLKSTVIMQDSQAAYILLGIENQTNIHYAMPVRNGIYDFLQYGKQVSDIAARHRKQKDKAGSSAEFLSGFYKTDKIVPVVTLVVYFGADEWDGPIKLTDMMENLSPVLTEYVQDYKIHLIQPFGISDVDLQKFQSSLREVLCCIKYSKDKEKLWNFMKDNPRMNMDVVAARVIEVMTNMSIEIPAGEKEIDMCKAVEDMIQDGKFEILINLVRDGILSVQDAAQRINMTEDEFRAKMK